MSYNPQNPFIVQSDKTVLLEVANSLYEEARDLLARFAELEKSPEHIHTYRITPLSLWNAAASGMKAEDMITALEKYGKFELPQNISQDILDYVERYGKIKLIKEDEELFLYSDDFYLIEEIWNNKGIRSFVGERVSKNSIKVPQYQRGHVKQALIKMGFPVEDLAGYVPGARFEFAMRDVTGLGLPFSLRDYQKEAVETFYAGGSFKGGSGVIVLPCGAGKTIVGLGVMEKLQCETLILSTNITAVRQWIDEICDKSFIPRDAVGEYTGELKEVKPITVTTYQILTYRKSKEGNFPHFALFNSKDWGLIIYDEVHLLPAEVFRITAEIQARRRLGLTATLVREDGREEDVFSLIGPKRFDIPWKELERKDWIATAECNEIRVDLPEDLRMEYAMAELRDKYRIAAENRLKFDVINALVERHKDDQVLVIGQYINQLEKISELLGAPLITGKVPNREREKLYKEFRSGDIKVLVVSKVANFAVDLPDANVAIEISGSFGSRQEEAQRLGRILRPKKGENIAYFYAVVTRDTRDQEFAANRQLFLTEQGYKYHISDYKDVLGDFNSQEVASVGRESKVPWLRVVK